MTEGRAPAALRIGQVRGWAYALLHLTPDQFYTMRPGEFWEAMEAYRKEQADDRRHVAELARGVAMILFNVQVTKKYRVSDPIKLWPMPWDENAEDAEKAEVRRLAGLSKEDQAAEAKKFFDRVKKNGRDSS